jgi:DNA-binding transcriptional MerR regulator
VPRDESSGHRRYPPELVAAVESLSCLRGAGMSVADMRAYVDNTRRYVAAKAELWAARERGDTSTEARVTAELIEMAKEFFDV